MPLYFFDVTDTGRTSHDNRGMELPSLIEARREALRALADIAKDELPNGDYRDFTIHIRENDGPPLLTASLSLRVEHSDPATQY
jgi:hypothetical protein